MNFSCSKIWNDSIYLRYPINKINKIGNLYFYENNNLLKCQNFFDIDIETDELNELKSKIDNMKSIRFSYIDSNKMIVKLKKWVLDNSYYFEEIDSWEAPRLEINCDVKEYLQKNIHSQIRKDYKHYLNNKGKYKFYNSNTSDVLKLWNYVLEIDFNSWKKDECSDMKSLDREDLQYLPFLLEKKKISNLLVVCDLQDKPLAYSLMFKNYDDYWYAVKWGSSTNGRKNGVGFYALFCHLEYLYNIDNCLKIDFWGRRNTTYDYLRNSYVVRKHIFISKKEC